MAAKRKNKKVSLKEFKAWLEGVEEMQPEDWHPTPEQWRVIREKINTIVETPTQRKASKSNNEQEEQQTNLPPIPPLPPGPPTTLAPIPQSTPVPPPVDPQIEISPAAEQVLKANGKLDEDMLVKEGPYQSDFV